MYLEYFGLREQPFRLTPDPAFLYLSKSHIRAKAYMDYTVWKRDGFVVITGEIGAGKTTLIHNLLSEVGENVTVIRILQTQLNEIEFLQAMLVEMGFPPQECSDTNKVALLNRLNMFLIDSCVQGKHVVLIVDEAQNLSPTVLEEIRMLAGVEPDKEKILNIILVGQPELNETLSRPDMEQLVQRIRLRFHVGALTEDETVEYIAHRLKIAGLQEGHAALFELDSMPLIYKYSGGIPRRINILCDTALVCAFADSLKSVSRKTLMDAVQELQWKPFRRPLTRKMWGQDGSSQSFKGQSSEVSTENAPSFVASGDQWGKLFSLVLKMLADMSVRMKNVDQQLSSITRLLNQQKSGTGDYQHNDKDVTDRVAEHLGTDRENIVQEIEKRLGR